VQFSRQPGFSAESLQGWKHWCIVAFIENSKKVTLSCPNKEVAEQIFGPGGLLNVYNKLPAVEEKDWGGREAVGGSPRSAFFPENLLKVVLDTLENNLLER
jgi:hypothetical protein